MVLCMFSSFYVLFEGTTVGAARGSGGIVTKETKAFFLETFGEAETPEALVKSLHSFALENFVYDEAALVRPQTTDHHRFVFKRQFHGVCLDFSVFVKAAFDTVCEEKGWDHAACAVVIGINSLFSEGHAVNYVVIENPDGSAKVFELDTTWELGRKEMGKALQGVDFYYPIGKTESAKEKVEALFDSYYQYRISIVV